MTHAQGWLEVFVDEIDQIHPDRSHLGAKEASQLLIAVTQLRGMIQSGQPGTGLVLICAGVDPSVFESPILKSGADNLLYKLVRLLYLAPLSRDEMAEMVRDLGRRMGVRVRDHQVVDFLYAEYGGHALLTRKACSLAVKGRPEDVIPWHMGLQQAESAASMRGEGTPFQQAGEILTSFGEWFPEETGLLRELWSSDPEDSELGRMLYAENREALIHAGLYGIVVPGTATARIRAAAHFVHDAP